MGPEGRHAVPTATGWRRPAAGLAPAFAMATATGEGVWPSGAAIGGDRCCGVGGELLPWQHYRAWPSRALSTSEAPRGGPEARGASIGGTRGNGFKLNLDDALWRNLLRRGR